jgi:hypothetical protein
MQVKMQMFIHNHLYLPTQSILCLKVSQSHGPVSQQHLQICFGIGFSSLIFLTVDIQVPMGASYCWTDKKKSISTRSNQFSWSYLHIHKYM